jgi:hypothetical protein
MTPREKAQSGLALLKEALLEYLANRPEGASASEIREGLGLEDSDSKGQRKGYVLWGLFNLLRHDGKVQINKTYRPNRMILVGKPEAKV